jgi:hypothetical protein
MVSTGRRLMQLEGIKGFYRGWFPHLFQAGGGRAFYLCTYELAKTVFFLFLIRFYKKGGYKFSTYCGGKENNNNRKQNLIKISATLNPFGTERDKYCIQIFC